MYDILKTQGVLPLVTQIGIKTAEIILKSASDSGIKIIEFAARSPDAKEIFAQMVNFRNTNNLNIKLAVGSILTLNDAETYHKLGAECIVCPHTDPEIGNYCFKNNLYWIPGASTLNEIIQANKLGAEIVKLFPADMVGGPDYIKAIKAPFPNLKLMPSGGVTLEENNLKSWFKTGVVCVGIGSHLFSKETLSQLDYNKSYEAFKNLITVVEKSRK
ncbi:MULTISPECIES: bifunctional 4-hydroxy-2-oxoglutarate aldolase/2-dehydro-3-deoxy-phosphogluconate aldolase [unclassified Flavobacterium]|uniref:bifunctional 4-hydroxy-2-oxoglutarate aldolase/2-dehydro-3-deoxy-phosphogluconate aldolase n=1 Tax=unclassified Flavobacterium TaxID=196869 RepID=UPI000F0CD99D|nr:MULTISPECIES: aldolase [unclassified Flavobacterium]AYN06078.1 aldolase [Flavobacterium sp. 140616W15]MCD0475080.1 aldolase [Flavobacterium sp. EDS]